MLLNKMNTMATCSGFAKKKVRCRSGYSPHFFLLPTFASHPFYSLLSSILECDVYSLESGSVYAVAKNKEGNNCFYPTIYFKDGKQIVPSAVIVVEETLQAPPPQGG